MSFQAAAIEAHRADDLPRAIELMRQAVAERPADPDLRLNLGLMLLTAGRWKEAWPLYEARHDPKLKHVNRLQPPFQGRRPWRGEPLEGKRIVLVPEQGFGDELMSCRFAPVLAAKGAKVILAVQPPLKALMKTLPGIVRVATHGERLAASEHDYWAYPLTVAALLGIEPSTIPSAVPYLAAEPERVARWRKRLGPRRHELRVGIAWRGRNDTSYDRSRNLALAQLAPLAAVDGVRLVSLQHGEPNADAGAPGAPPVWVPDGEPLGDFADAAALAASLDLVISIDSSPGHLAGSLGLPAWTLVPAPPDWRWFTKRQDTPWYPTMRLLRQPAPGDWAPVMARAARELAGIVAALRAVKARGGAEGRREVVKAGHALLARGRLRDAERAFRAAIAWLPDEPNALHGLGMVAIRARKPRAARSLLAAALRSAQRRRAPGGALSLMLAHLGQALRQSGERDHAANAYRESLKLAPNAQVKAWLGELEGRQA